MRLAQGLAALIDKNKEVAVEWNSLVVVCCVACGASHAVRFGKHIPGCQVQSAAQSWTFVQVVCAFVANEEPDTCH